MRMSRELFSLMCKYDMGRFFSYVFVMLLLMFSQPSQADNISDLLERLDKSLSHKTEYEQIKKERIEKLQRLLRETSDLEILYKSERELFEEYKSYRYDSASVCAQRCLDLAIQMGNKEYEAEAQCNIAFGLVAAGIPMEANRILCDIDASTLPQHIRQNYYFTCYKLWSEEANRIQGVNLSREYSDQSNTYLDSLCMCLDASDPELLNFGGSRYMRLHQYKEAIASFEKYLSVKSLDAHKKAMAYAEMAWAYRWLNNEDKAIENFILSAIFDNESATREITALYLLAQHLTKRGDTDRAFRYVHLALDDINFYDANQRKLELGSILPQIEQERYNIISSQRNTMMVAVVLAFLLVLAVFASYMLLRKKNRLLSLSEEQERKNLEVIEAANQQLIEANKIKTEYIGQTFCANAEFITKLDKLYKAIERQITTKQYDKIKETVSNKKLEQERENMYAAFDSTFLGLFPNFITQYNKLFDEKDRRYPELENSLTSEMRIFALIRLGITDSERIGNFLDYSVHTVNTYKTRIKNRSIVDNDKFEGMIRMI